MKKELLLVVILLSSFAIALEVPDYKDKYVNDFAGIFTSSQITSMRASLQELDYNTTAEVAVVTIADCGGDYDGFAMKLAEKWKIGKADKDNGLLILYCQAENKITVKTGYGLEGILPDSKLGRMLDEYYVPQRDNGNVQEGIILFTEQVSNEIKNNAEEVISGRKNNSISIWIVFLPLLLIIILFIIFFSIFRKARNLTRQSTKSQTGYENIPELKQKGRQTLSSILFILLFAVIFLSQEIIVIIVALISFFIINTILFKFRKCPKCGKKLKESSKDSKYHYYTCENNHMWKIALAAAGGFWLIGHHGGGFGGGGFGGGGFGGGGFGGGGASR